MEKKDKIVSTWLYKKNPRVALENDKTKYVEVPRCSQKPIEVLFNH